MVKILANSTTEKSCRARTAEKKIIFRKKLYSSLEKVFIFISLWLKLLVGNGFLLYKNLLLYTAVKQS